MALPRWTEDGAAISRRRLLVQAAAGGAALCGGLPSARAASDRDLRFRCLWQGSEIGEHRVAFRAEADRLVVETYIEITAKVLFFTVFSLRHEAREVWQGGRLQAVVARTQSEGRSLEVAGEAVGDGFRVVGKDGPFLAAGHLLTSDALWDSRIVEAARLIDVQHGGEIGLVTKRLGKASVETPRGRIRATRHRIITPYYAGSLFYDEEQRWVKALVEFKGETLEYALAT
ncbi:MAG: DUF6134 family protein [Tistlia sp.]|uniref:DUF6134 family protein n=1 Tax=Tistlia sp. TaxID=3057121 RepID=UPI0034A539AA